MIITEWDIFWKSGKWLILEWISLRKMRYLLEILWVTIIDLTGYLFRKLWVIIIRQDIFWESVSWWLFQWISFAEGRVWLLIEWVPFKKGGAWLLLKGDHYSRLKSILCELSQIVNLTQQIFGLTHPKSASNLKFRRVAQWNRRNFAEISPKFRRKKLWIW